MAGHRWHGAYGLDDRKPGTTASPGAWSVWFEPSRSAYVRSAARRAAGGPSKAEPAADAGPAAPQAPPCQRAIADGLSKLVEGEL